ncbi:MAG: hypothetical protein LUH10_11055 [Tannerellaceae bacterium]|nr:hypothetical protein [Tannerellaceae bacterium]
MQPSLQDFPLGKLRTSLFSGNQTNCYQIVVSWLKTDKKFLSDVLIKETTLSVVTYFITDVLLSLYFAFGASSEKYEEIQHTIEDDIKKKLRDNIFFESASFTEENYSTTPVQLIENFKNEFYLYCKEVIEIKDEQLREFGDLFENSLNIVMDNVRDRELIPDIIVYQEDSLYAQITNRYMSIFNQFCLSVLKAEYIFNSSLSESEITPIKDVIDKATFFSGELEKEEVILKEKLGAREVEWGKNYNLQNLFILINYLCEDYFSFNSQIHELLSNTEIDPDIFQQEDHYRMQGIKERIFILKNQIYTNESFLSIIELFPPLFQEILKMTLIDHNFAVAEKEFKTLYILDKLLEGVIDILPDKTNKKWEQQNERLIFIDSDIVHTLKKTLTLLKSKTEFLIYKILMSINNENKSKYQFIHENTILILGKSEGKKGVSKKLAYEEFKFSGLSPEENILEKQVEFYTNNIKNKKYSLEVRSNDFSAYEIAFFNALIRDLPAATIKGFKPLQEYLVNWNLKREGYEYINLYNKNIVEKNVKHFCYAGLYIKKLNSDTEDVIIDLCLKFLKAQKQDITSCAFITKNLKWVLNVITERCEAGKFEYKKDFKLINLADLLLIEFEKLVDSIEKGCYCRNFATLFEDCFYSFHSNINSYNYNRISRYQQHTDNGLKHLHTELINKDNWIFISSTWLPPIGKNWLKSQLKDLKNRKKKIVARFYGSFYESSIKEVKEIMDSKEVVDKKLEEQKLLIENYVQSNNKEIEVFKEDQLKNEQKLRNTLHTEGDQTRRSMVQTLGIFAAFLALATTAINTFNSNFDALQASIIMLGITTCLIIFVCVLHFTIKSAERIPETDTETKVEAETKAEAETKSILKVLKPYLPLLIILLCLGFLLGYLLYAHETREKSPQQTDTPHIHIQTNPGR